MACELWGTRQGDGVGTEMVDGDIDVSSDAHADPGRLGECEEIKG